MGALKLECVASSHHSSNYERAQNHAFIILSMPSIIETLALENQALVTVTENDSAQYALSRMIEHDFSQLPVVDNARKLKGIITSDSILRAVSYFKVVPERLKVSHAIVVKAITHRDEEGLPELLRGLRDTSAIPIVNGDRKVIAIVTHYDTAEYYRHRAADLMLAADIELTLRDLILSASNSDSDESDNEAMAELIKGIVPSEQKQKRKFRGALMHYINQAGIADHTLDTTLLDSVFDQHLKKPAPKKTFKKLTLSELIHIVQNIWSDYQQDFRDMPWEVVGPLLDDVRDTRNKVAHFNEVTDEQRKQLQFCADFLDNHRPSLEPTEVPSTIINNIYTEFFDLRGSRTYLNASRELARSIQNASSTAKTVQISDIENKSGRSIIVPLPEEELEDNDSRYAPLAIWLQAQEEDKVTYTFKEIEAIIGDELPPSARSNRSWWANDKVGHVQSIQWLDVDWRVSSVNMSTERVVFSRMGDRQSAYIEFFTHLQAKLHSITGLQIVPQNNQQGKNWLTFAVNPEHDDSATPLHIAFSFSRRSRFRIEKYIDMGEHVQNKQVFDQLQAQRTEIETEFGASLTWERLEHRRGCRIAYYRPDSSITDNAEKLEQLQNWAIEMLPKFYNALSDRFFAAQKAATAEEEQKPPT